MGALTLAAACYMNMVCTRAEYRWALAAAESRLSLTLGCTTSLGAWPSGPCLRFAREPGPETEAAALLSIFRAPARSSFLLSLEPKRWIRLIALRGRWPFLAPCIPGP